MTNIDLGLIRKYDVKGPRYTSYPTALQFTEFDQIRYRQAVATSEARDQPISLYCHIPFCSTLCYYCACSKIVTRDTTKAARYLRYLEQEINLQAPLFEGRRVFQLHLGGGTPTFLTDDQLIGLMDLIRSKFDLADDEAGEFGIEIDPRTVDRDRIHALRKAGFNRLSLGIQDFEPDVQKAVNRKQSFESTLEVVEAARSAGFRSLSVDLIYGLPHQTLATMGDTLRQVIELSPDRISIYNYAHLPDRFPSQKRINVVDLPGADQKLLIMKQCIDILTSAGYSYIGMDHFAKPTDELAIAQANGTLHRNFQGYSTYADCEMVAMGVTAISQVGRIYSQNAKSMDAYEHALDQGSLPIERGVMIDGDDWIRKEVIMALICQFEVDFAKVEDHYGIRFRGYFEQELAALSPFEEDGLVGIHPGKIVVTTLGRLLIRNICMVFDRHLNEVAQANNFSKAI